MLTTRLGISLKQIRAYFNTQMTDDYKTIDIKEKYKAESGFEIKTDLSVNIDSSSVYRGCLEFFGTYDNLEAWTVRFQNDFQLKIWEFIALLLKFEVFYDEKQSVQIQYRQSMRLGLVAGF